jgi:hypothetical protein
LYVDDIQNRADTIICQEYRSGARLGYGAFLCEAKHFTKERSYHLGGRHAGYPSFSSVFLFFWDIFCCIMIFFLLFFQAEVEKRGRKRFRQPNVTSVEKTNIVNKEMEDGSTAFVRAIEVT